MSMMKLKPPVVLYWVDGPVATADEQTDAFQYGPNVKIRNAQHDTKDGALEPHDAVAGPAIPKRYTDADSAAHKPAAVPYAEWLQDQKANPPNQGQTIGSNDETAYDRLANVKTNPKRTKAVNKAPAVAAGDQAGGTSADPAPSPFTGSTGPAPEGSDPFADPAPETKQ